jgi:ribonuclease HI
MNKLIIHTDGGSRGNPGPAACAAVFLNSDKKTIDQTSKYLGVSTNNQAEYYGVIIALELLLENKEKYSSVKQVDFFLDSELVTKQLLGEYRIKNKDLMPLAQKIFSLKSQLPFVFTFTHVRRHLNHLPDTLLNQELDSHRN